MIKEINSLIAQGLLRVDEETGYMYSNPAFVGIESTVRCNLDCVICEHIYFKDQGHSFKDMPIEIFNKIIPFIKTAKLVFLSKAGEPLMAKNLVYMIKKCKQYNCRVAFASNGSLMNEHIAEQLVDLDLDWIELSIDGIESFYKIRGFNIDIFIKNIKNLNKIKARKNKSKPSLTFTFVVMKDNLEELPEVVKLGSNLGVNRIFVHPLRIRYACLVGQNINAIPEQTKDILDISKKLANRLGIEFIPRQMPFVKDEGSRKSDECICMSPFERFFVDVDGNTNIICCGDKNIGQHNGYFNVNNTPLDKIWNSDEYRKVRLQLLLKNPDRECANCSLIFGTRDNLVNLLGPEDYVPGSLKRFSTKLWIENLEKVSKAH